MLRPAYTHPLAMVRPAGPHPFTTAHQPQLSNQGLRGDASTCFPASMCYTSTAYRTALSSRSVRRSSATGAKMAKYAFAENGYGIRGRRKRPKSQGHGALRHPREADALTRSRKGLKGRDLLTRGDIAPGSSGPQGGGSQC